MHRILTVRFGRSGHAPWKKSLMVVAIQEDADNMEEIKADDLNTHWEQLKEDYDVFKKCFPLLSCCLN